MWSLPPTFSDTGVSDHHSRITFSSLGTVGADFLGPVVQSIVSLTSSLRGQVVKCFMT